MEPIVRACTAIETLPQLGHLALTNAECVADPCQERGMIKMSKPIAWTKPELRRLGEINDVAGAQTPLTQAANVKS